MTDEVHGLSIPFRIDSATGGVAHESAGTKIKENIIHILLTGVGERVMRRDYGGGIRQLVHDPNNDALRAIVRHQIASSIGQWEPRVLLKDVMVTQENGMLIVEIKYVIRRTREPHSLTVPLGLGGVPTQGPQGLSRPVGLEGARLRS
jgi:phage baseplate assembly protein W